MLWWWQSARPVGVAAPLTGIRPESFTWVRADDRLAGRTLVQRLNVAFPRIARIAKPMASLLMGSGSPEGKITARVGTGYLRTDGGAGTTLYVKESGTGSTGWIGK